MAAHPVERKLEREIIPYLVSARRLTHRPLYVTYHVYAYCHDLLAALAGFGFAPPLFQLLMNPTEGQQLAGVLPSHGAAISLGLIAVVAWAVLKVVVTREEGEKRATLASSCRKEFKGLEMRVQTELAKPNPIPGLTTIQQEIIGVVERHIAENSWPWSGPDQAPAAQEKVKKTLQELRQRFEQDWEPPPPVQQA